MKIKDEKGSIGESIVKIVVILIVLAIMFLPSIFSYGNVRTLDITIKDKYIKGSNKSQKYLVVDTDNNTYEITDLFFKFKFNSTDIYNSLDKDKTYKVETSGFRIPFFSSYPNINKILSN